MLGTQVRDSAIGGRRIDCWVARVTDTVCVAIRLFWIPDIRADVLCRRYTVTVRIWMPIGSSALVVQAGRPNGGADAATRVGALAAAQNWVGTCTGSAIAAGISDGIATRIVGACDHTAMYGDETENEQPVSPHMQPRIACEIGHALSVAQETLFVSPQTDLESASFRVLHRENAPLRGHTFMNDRWAKKRMRFRFRLGETTLFAPELDVAVHRGRFLDESEKTETFVLPSGERDVRVFVALSHPIEGHIEPVKILPEALRLATHQYRRSFIRVEGTFENYLTKLPSSRRNQIKRKVKKLKEHSGGTLDFRVYRTPEEILGFHALAREVSKKTYQERMLGKGLPVHREFMEAMQARAKDGRAIGFLLFLDGVAQAYLYAEIEGEFMAYDFVGFDPAAGDLSPGNVLQISILEWVFREKPCRYFDFGEGQSQYKEFFATEHVPCADLYFFPRNASGYALFGAQAGLHYLSRGIVSGLERAGVKEKVKAFFRRGWIAPLLGRTKERAPVEGDPSGDPPA